MCLMSQNIYFFLFFKYLLLFSVYILQSLAKKIVPTLRSPNLMSLWQHQFVIEWVVKFQRGTEFRTESQWRREALFQKRKGTRRRRRLVLIPRMKVVDGHSFDGMKHAPTPGSDSLGILNNAISKSVPSPSLLLVCLFPVTCQQLVDPLVIIH